MVKDGVDGCMRTKCSKRRQLQNQKDEAGYGMRGEGEEVEERTEEEELGRCLESEARLTEVAIRPRI